MALHVGTGDPLGDGKASRCQYCSQRLGEFGFYFTCHVCGARYCYIHLRKHDLAHPLAPKIVLAQ